MHRASLSDYDHSGYDKDHMAPAVDFALDAAEKSDSFSMANMAPQLPGLNRAEWEHLEETVRAWAFARRLHDPQVDARPAFRRSNFKPTASTTRHVPARYRSARCASGRPSR